MLTKAAVQATEDWLTGLVADGRIGKMEPNERLAIVKVLVESVFALAHFHAPFVPAVADAIVQKIKSPVLALPDLQLHVPAQPQSGAQQGVLAAAGGVRPAGRCAQLRRNLRGF